MEACEVAVPRPGRQARWVRLEAVLAPTAPGQPPVCHAVLIDNSATQRAQAALRHSEEQFRNLAQALPDAVYTLDLPTHQVIYFNHDVFLGYRRAELLAEIDLLGPRLDPNLPPSISGHNNYWLWGMHGCDANLVIAIVSDTPQQLARKYESVMIVGHMDNPYSMPFEHRNIYLLRGRRSSASFEWADERFYF